MADGVKCGHKGSTGKPCRLAAGWGTSHPGTGYCSYHDSSAITPLSGRHLPLLQLLDEEQRPLVARMIKDDSGIFDLRFEIATLKTRYAESAGYTDIDGSPLPNATPHTLANLARAIATLTKTLDDMEHSKHMFIHIEVMQMMLGACSRVAAQYITDPVMRGRYARDLKDQIRKIIPQSTAEGIASSMLGRQASPQIVDSA